MNPQKVFCPRPDCPLVGQRGAGNVVIHSQKEQRYFCKACRHTFSARIGTVFYRKKTSEEEITLALVLLAYGCPPVAIAVAFGVDERTVYAWLGEAGSHCQAVHEALVQSGKVELGHVQADEVWVKGVGRKLWLAMAVCVPSRLWLGAVLSERRDKALAQRLVGVIRTCASSLSLLVTTDGWRPYKEAFLKGFRYAVRNGRRGRPRLVLEECFLLGLVVKRYERKRVTGVVQRALRGTQEALLAAVRATGGGTMINTAFIERLNATFRGRLASLARRTRCLAHKEETLRAGVFLVGCVYNFCASHDSLQQRAEGGEAKGGKVERTPAMAARLTDHRWTPLELFTYQVPPYAPTT